MTKQITQKMIHIENIPFHYSLVRSKKRRRTLALSVEKPSQVEVRAPFRISIKEADAFLNKNYGWILKRHKELLEQSHIKPMYQWGHGDPIPLMGKTYTLHLIHEPFLPIKIYTDQDRLILHISTLKDSPQNSQLIHRSLINWYKEQARIVATEKMQYWAERLNVKYNALIICGPHKRWGSCNYRNDIRINWRAFLAPKETLDYLIAHELCHIKHKNHSAAFWQLLESVLPDYKSRQKILRQHHRYLSI